MTTRTHSTHRGQRAHREAGNVSLFGIGLGFLILVVGGLSIDLWQIISTRTALVEVADATAAAAANQIDIGNYRTNGVGPTGKLLIDRPTAESVGYAEAQNQPEWDVADQVIIDFTHDQSGVVVQATGTVDFALLGLVSGTDSMEMQVEARAWPRVTLFNP